MQSLLTKKKGQHRMTESLIKESLLRQLSYSVKEIQLEYSQSNEVFTTNEACNNLLIVLEAIFLHGLKKGILQTALKTVGGGVDDTRPQPSFWRMVSSYTHRDTVTTIRNLTQINTDVGRSRVWIRIALNETEITSYIKAMEKERRPVNSSYNNYAFLRDRETCDTACKLLEGIITVQFDIPINANILNTWSTEPLVLSGIWSPPMKIAVSNAIDVAEGLEVEYEDDDACSIKTSSSVTTLSTLLALDENQALKIILETPLKKSDNTQSGTTSTVLPSQYNTEYPIVEEDEENEVEEVQAKSTTPSEISPIGNSLSTASGWSSSDPHDDALGTIEEEDHDESKTFSSLLERYGHSPKDEKNYETILQKMYEKPTADQTEENNDFEICQNQSNEFEDQLFRIVPEKGLKAQNYTCYSCQLSIGLNFAEARYCHFTAKYYCNNCHLNDVSVIPSRLIYNWDHKKYAVSSKVSQYLSDIWNGYLIDVKKLNPKLYGVVSEMQNLRTLRLKLNFLRAYLYTCRQPVIMELQKRVWPRDYLYENIHTYTFSDLCKVTGDGLASELNTVVSFAREHVLNCWLCSQKGFICEICRNPKVIYPFDCDSTYHCRKCYAVYHGTCLSSSKNCPKCKRLRRRTESPPDQSDEFD